jgi:hypothetical protein
MPVFFSQLRSLKLFAYKNCFVMLILPRKYLWSRIGGNNEKPGRRGREGRRRRSKGCGRREAREGGLTTQSGTLSGVRQNS